MTPLRIRCRVTTPIVMKGDGLLLDGLLAYAAFRSLPDEEREALPDISTTDFPADFDLPLERWRAPVKSTVDKRLLDDAGMLWGWKASDVVAQWEGRQPIEVRRPAPVHQMRRMSDAKSVNLSSARYKPLNRMYEGWWPKDGELTWYAVGDLEEVARLLQHVPNVGRLHNQGHGLVERSLDGTPQWRIDDECDDYAWQRRWLPVGLRRNGPRARRSVRAPHWHRSRLADCVGESAL